MLQMLLSPKDASKAWALANNLLEKHIKQAKYEEKSSSTSTPRTPGASSTPRTPRTPHTPHTPLSSTKTTDIILSTYDNFNLVAYRENNETFVFAYNLKQQLGEAGAQGVVYKAQQLYHDIHKNHHPENIIVLKHSSKIDAEEDFQNENEILSTLGRLRGFAKVSKESECLLFLFSDFCEGENLLDTIYSKVPAIAEEATLYSFSYSKKPHLTLEKLKISKAILEAVLSLHSDFGIFHRDLKSANIIIANDFENAKLIDFGTSCKMCNTDRTFKGSTGYQAFEMTLPTESKDPNLSRPYYSSQTEYFSLGIVLLEVLSGFNYQSFIRQQLATSTERETYVIEHKHILNAFNDILDMTEPKKDDSEENKLLWALAKICKAIILPNPNLRLSYKQLHEKYLNFNQRLTQLLAKKNSELPAGEYLMHELGEKFKTLSLAELTLDVKAIHEMPNNEVKNNDTFLSPNTSTGRLRSASVSAQGESRRPDSLKRTSRQLALPKLSIAISTSTPDSPKRSPQSEVSSSSPSSGNRTQSAQSSPGRNAPTMNYPCDNPAAPSIDADESIDKNIKRFEKK